MKSVLISLALAALPSHGDGVQVLRDSSNTLLLTSGIKEAGATHGKVEAVNGTLRYTPEPGFSGADKVTTVLAADGSESVLEIEVRTHPNFLFILADDQSWTGLSAKMDKVNPASGSDFHRTPHLDQLAAEGTRFSRGYSPAPNCSPTRYANLTGKTCARLKFTDILGRGHTKKSIGRPLIPINKATFAIKDEETTIPELLKSLANANYTTAHFGKWHLGGGGPEKHGFDVSDGPTGNREGDLGPVVNEDPKRAFQIAKRGNAFMEKATASGQPFYCQLSHYAVDPDVQMARELLWGLHQH